jgi:hypothetical protein
MRASAIFNLLLFISASALAPRSASAAGGQASPRAAILRAYAHTISSQLRELSPERASAILTQLRDPAHGPFEFAQVDPRELRLTEAMKSLKRAVDAWARDDSQARKQLETELTGLSTLAARTQGDAAASVAQVERQERDRPATSRTLFNEAGTFGASFAAGGRLMARGLGQAGTLSVRWLEEDREVLSRHPRIEGIKDTDFSPDGKWLAVSFKDGPVQIYDTLTWKPTATIAGTEMSEHVRFVGAGKRLFARSWKVAQAVELTDTGSVKPDSAWPAISLMNRKVLDAGAARTGELVLFDSTNGKTEIRSLTDGTLLGRADFACLVGEGPVPAYFHDRRRLAIVVQDNVTDVLNRVKIELRDAQGAVLASLDWSHHPENIKELVALPGEDLFAVASYRGPVRIVRIEDRPGNPLQLREVYAGSSSTSHSTRNLRLSADGKYLRLQQGSAIKEINLEELRRTEL